MLSRSSPASVPEMDRDRDRDNLPLKKREQRWTAPPSHQQQCEAATFKAPYPRRSCAEARWKQASPFRPFPKRAPPLHQPWMHACAPTSSTPQVVSAFRAHRGWTDWTESNPQCPGWEGAPFFQHHTHLSPLLHAGQHPSRLSAGSRVGDCDQLRGRNFGAWWTVDERNGGPYFKRSRKTESLPKAGRPGLSTPPPGSPQQVLQTSPRLFRTSPSEQSFSKSSQACSAHASARDGASAQSGRPSPHSRPPNRLPWLLPHFLAGSLIELRDGRLRRVEHLQTEDFLLGALACPDLRLSCCTVQSITPSASSSISRLLILLHDQQSQVSRFSHSSRSFEQFHLHLSKLSLSPGAGGRPRRVPVLCPGPRLVIVQPSEDRPPLRPSVPPAERRGRVPGPHAALRPRAPPAGRPAAGSNAHDFGKSAGVADGAAKPRSPRARTTGRRAEEGADPEETSISP